MASALPKSARRLKETHMERRTFFLGLIGGLAAVALAPRVAEAAPLPQAPANPDALPETLEVAAPDKAALEAADKEFSQLYVRRRVVYRRPVRRVYYRRPVRRVVYVRPRRVYYRRPVRRVIRVF
jgi:hypothetical protein